MNKIFNWTFGSIFRTIGRIIAYLIIGFILFSFINFDKIKDDIKKGISLDSWVGIPRTYAMTLTNDAVIYSSVYSPFKREQFDYHADYSLYFSKQLFTSQNPLGRTYDFEFQNTLSLSPNVDYVSIPFAISHDTISNGQHILPEYCEKWEQRDSTYYCVQYGISDNYFEFEPGIDMNDFNIQVFVYGIPGTMFSCSIDGNQILCPYVDSFKGITVTISLFHQFGSTDLPYFLYLWNYFTTYEVRSNGSAEIIQNQNTNTQNIINNQNQNNHALINAQESNTNKTIEALTDSNTTQTEQEASSFFSNFSTTDNGGLSSIITAPLSAIQSLTNATCSPLVLPLPFVNENLTLPCMRSIYDSTFGGFMVLYDVITIGIISYWILVRIFNLVKDFKNPDHDEIEVVDL